MGEGLACILGRQCLAVSALGSMAQHPSIQAGRVTHTVDEGMLAESLNWSGNKSSTEALVEQA